MKDLLIITSLLFLSIVIYTLFTRRKRNPPQVGSFILQSLVDRILALQKNGLHQFFAAFYIILKPILIFFAPMIAGWFISPSFETVFVILLGQLFLGVILFEWLRSCLKKINGKNDESKDWDVSIYNSGVFIAGIISLLVVCRPDFVSEIEERQALLQTRLQSMTITSDSLSYSFPSLDCPFTVTFPYKPRITKYPIESEDDIIKGIQRAAAHDENLYRKNQEIISFESRCFSYNSDQLKKDIAANKSYSSFLINFSKRFDANSLIINPGKNDRCKSEIMFSKENKQPYVRFECLTILSIKGRPDIRTINYGELHNKGNYFFVTQVNMPEKFYPYNMASKFMKSIREN